MPGSTPLLGLPYPLPADAVVDYPTLGRQLAEKIESNGGAFKLWDSVEAGVQYPSGMVSTPPLPATFKHLLVAWSGRTNSANPSDSMFLDLNDNAGANYSFQQMRGFGTTVTAAEGGAGSTAMLLGDIPGGAGEASAQGVGLFVIPNYAAIARPGFVGFASSPRLAASNLAGFLGVIVTGGRYALNGPVNKLHFYGTGGSLVGLPYCRFTVYALN